VARTAGDYQAAIFDAHALFLDDAGLLDQVRAMLFDEQVTADYAWYTAIEQAAEAFAALEDPYQAARAADVRDIGRQVLARLGGADAARSSAPAFTEPGILVAADLAPSDTAQLDRARVLAICTAGGGPTSHSAILARALGIPAVVGLGGEVLRVPAGTLLVVDGTGGQVWPAPPDDVVARYRAQAAVERAAQDAARAASAAPAVTRDGRRIEVAANAASVAEARAGMENGAEGIGLLRTEFVFLDRHEAPGEDEQAAAYAAIADVMGALPVIIRTLDVGGDKPLPYLPLAHEDNPFLGQRAVRLCLARPELFRTQLRAILRASAGHRLRLMFPMIAERDELRAARALLAETRRELEARHVPVAPELEVGIMVEIPAAALLADRLAAEVDFFSVGTNDLTQYTLAAERGNPQLAYLADGLHPAVLREIRATVLAADAAGRWVGVCGELAGDPLAIPVLVGLGVRELSMAPASIPRAKQVVRELTYAAAAALAVQALEQASAAEVRRLVISH
jgi:phosphocarrier protein FPr